MKLLWEPSKQIIEQANITKFIAYVNSRFKLKLKDYHDLYDWSISSVANFWEGIWLFTEIIASQPYDEIVNNLDKFPPSTNWFQGVKMNYAENLLRYRDERVALLSRRENEEPVAITYIELYARVARVARALRDLGVSSGDRVTAYMPNTADTIIYMLAAVSTGAIWASCGVELGEDVALDRLGQVEPKILFSVDAYIYKGREYDLLPKVQELASNISSLSKVVILPYVNASPDITGVDKAVLFEDFEASESNEIIFEQLPFNHPLFIMFSSGTTGKPKCMVQSAGGVLINHLKELILHHDLKREDNLLYLCSPSWMMWNWLTTGLATGTTIVLYDGNPLFPDWKLLWELIDSKKISIFGCSATYINYLKNIGAKPGEEFELKSLREISQTGSALSEEGFEYVYQEIKKDLHFNSISGGTDINGCFAAGTPTLPVYAGQLQVRALGMRVQSYDGNGSPVFDEQGELVCELPSPSMPLYFWGDPENERYTNAYFNYFEKNVWRHGDYIEIFSKTGGLKFHGRSDSVLKPSGVRIGTSEIYGIVEEFDEIADSLAIGQQWHNDQRIILFVQLNNSFELSEDLISAIKLELHTKASPRHVPSVIIAAPEIPYTFSGKKIESSITNIIHGRLISNRGSMRNPKCLKFYEDIVSSLKS
jgi:acetoacetyl-CoA synthetase